jgi:nicotinate-nucleotide adenylyltransferase
MRTALFGGTFDPPHRGHLAIARAAADRFALDRVLFAPAGLQPLKLDTRPTPFATRLALVTAACQPGHPDSDPRFVPSGIDAPNPDGRPNYTVDSLTALAAQHPHDTLFNLVGADAFLTLPKWREPDRLLELAEWIVVTRPGFPLTEPELVPLALAPLFLTPAQRARIHILSGIAEDVSATALRSRLRAADPCLDLLPASVAAFIARHNLYR